MGDRVGVLLAPANLAMWSGAALPGRNRDPAGALGSPDRLPGAAPGDGRGRRDAPWHRSRPHVFHHRPGDRQGPTHRRGRCAARGRAGAHRIGPAARSAPAPPGPRQPTSRQGPISRYAAPPDQAQVLGTSRITSIKVTVHSSANPGADGRSDRTLQLLRTAPLSTWRACEIASLEPDWIAPDLQHPVGPTQLTTAEPLQLRGLGVLPRGGHGRFSSHESHLTLCHHPPHPEGTSRWEPKKLRLGLFSAATGSASPPDGAGPASSPTRPAEPDPALNCSAAQCRGSGAVHVDR